MAQKSVRFGQAQGMWCSAAPAIPDSGILHYDFESQSDPVVDRWGDNDGTVNGAGFGNTRVKFGAASISFDGGDDYVRIGSLGSNPKAIAYFAYPAGNWNGSDERAGQFENKSGDHGIRQNTGNFQGEGDLPIAMVGSGSNEVTGVEETQSFSSNSWHSVVFNWNGSNYDIYIDDSQQALATGSGGHAGLFPSIDDVDLGRGGPRNYFEGNIDQLKLFDAALTEPEISNFHSTGSI